MTDIHHLTNHKKAMLGASEFVARQNMVIQEIGAAMNLLLEKFENVQTMQTRILEILTTKESERTK